MCGGVTGVWTLSEKSQDIGFRSNTGSDPLEITELPSQLAFNVGSLSAL